MRKIGSLCLVVMLLLTVLSVFSIFFSDKVNAAAPDYIWHFTPSEWDNGYQYMIYQGDTIFVSDLADSLRASGDIVVNWINLTTANIDFTWTRSLQAFPWNDEFYINDGDWLCTKTNLVGGIHDYDDTMIPLNPKLGIFVYDNDGDTMTVNFSTNASGSWGLIETFNNVANNTFVVCSNITNVTEYNTRYWIRANVSDGTDSYEETVNFTTMQDPNNPPVFSNPNPTNGSTNVSIATATWNITIEDPDADLFNWTIETSPNVGSNSSNSDTNGSKLVDLSNLQYLTNYTVYVNATGSWTNETFWFETEANTPSSISNETPTNDSIAINRKPQCSINVTDPGGDTMNVSFYENTTGAWVLSHYEDVTGTVVDRNYTNAGKYSTTYWWKVTVYDGTDTTTGIYHFITRSKPSENGDGGGEEPSLEGEWPAGLSSETILLIIISSACIILAVTFIWIYFKW